MVAPLLGQILRMAGGAELVKAAFGSNKASLGRFLAQAAAAGHGAAEVIEYLRSGEQPGKAAAQQTQVRRAQQGVATPSELARVQDDGMDVPGALRTASRALGPAAAVAGLFGDGQAQTPQPHPNAAPSNKQSVMAALMKKAKKQSPLGLQSIRQQREMAAPGEIARDAVKTLKASVDELAPTVFSQALQASQQGVSAGEIASSLRKAAKRDVSLAKELAKLRRVRNMPLERVIEMIQKDNRQTSQAPLPQAAPPADMGENTDAVIAEFNRLMEEALGG